jgi:hypothetical protein
MNQNSRLTYAWIVDQLVGIRSLETRLTHDLAAGGKGEINHIRRGMAELELRLALLDHALNAHQVR